MAEGLLLVLHIVLAAFLIETVKSEIIDYEDGSDTPLQVTWFDSWGYIYLQSSQYQIKRITAIDSMPNIGQVTITDNIVLEFPDFTNCAQSLTEIIMNNNQISSIPAARLNVLTSLVKLWLHYNLLTALPDVSGPSASLRDISVSFNQFTSIPSFVNLTPFVTHFYINNNPIALGTVDLSTFQLSSAIGIDLGNMAVDNIIFSNPASVAAFEDLFLYGNNIDAIPDFAPLADTLKNLDMSGNGLQTFGTDDMRLINQLNIVETLVMKNNGIETLPNVCQMTNSTTTVDFSGNPLHCDCRLRWLKAADLTRPNVYKPNDLTCASPPNMAAGSWVNFSVEDFTCESKQVSLNYHIYLITIVKTTFIPKHRRMVILYLLFYCNSYFLTRHYNYLPHK